MEDLEQFHAKRGLQLRVPVWQNILVNLYDLFLAVYDRGGYYKVCYALGLNLAVYIIFNRFAKTGHGE